MKLKLEKPGLTQIARSDIKKNFDPKAVARLVRNHDAAIKTQTLAALSAAEKEIEFLDRAARPGLFAVDESKVGARQKELQKMAEAMSRETPPVADPVSGHNPNLFPPFFDGGHSGVSGGAVTTPTFRRRPDIGQISLSVAAYLPGGHIDRTAAMSALTLSASTEMVTAAVNTFVAGTVTAISLLGYGRATATLTITISASGTGGFRSATGALLLGTIAFGSVRTPLTNMTASTRLMVRAGDLVMISAGLRVTAGCGGLICSATSNFAMSGTTMCLT